jgi:hypothetical protein
MRAKEFTVKPRDPNWKTLQAKRTSGASGMHKDKKRQQKQGYEKHKKPADVSESVSYGQMPADAVRILSRIYDKESQGVEQHEDEEGAKRIAKELNDAAKSLGVSQYMRNLYNSAARSAHMDFDTDPGGFENWFPYVGSHLHGLYKIHQEKGSYDNDDPDLEPDVD